MYTKADIFNMAKSALLLTSGNIANADNDPSLEAKEFRKHYASALEATLQDLDLDGLSETVTLELLEQLTNDPLWMFVYKYPSNCAVFRRISSGVLKDGEYTHIRKSVRMRGSQKVIYTNKQDAEADIITTAVGLDNFDGNSAQALAHRIAWQSAPLIVGEGAKKFRQEIFDTYRFFIGEAQKRDQNENFNFQDPYAESGFVSERTS